MIDQLIELILLQTDGQIQQMVCRGSAVQLACMVPQSFSQRHLDVKAGVLRTSAHFVLKSPEDLPRKDTEGHLQTL